MSEKLNLPTSNQIRLELTQLVLRDLLGPAGGEEEIIDEAYVRDRYILGLLAPRGQSVIPEEAEDLAFTDGDGEDGVVEPPTIRNSTLLPSSMGLTFTLDSSAEVIQIKAAWGRYGRIHSEELGLELERPHPVWKRTPIEAVSPAIPVKIGRMQRWIPNPEFPDVYVDGLFRQRNGEWIITLFLVNAQEEPKKLRDTAWLFQPELSVRAPDGAAIFRQRRTLRHVHADEEETAMSMLYREQVEFAVGHGVAVHAELAPGSYDRAVLIKTVIAPGFELPRVTPPTSAEIPGLQGLTLDMKTLAGLADNELAGALNPLVIAYAEWIGGLETQLSHASIDLQSYSATAQQTIDTCKQNLKRIQAGIDLLSTNAQAARAFRFANQTMALQRIHTLLTESIRREEGKTLEELDVEQNRTWYPFQLAFILLNLPGLTDPLSAERSHPTQAIADVLWFPTGGGKTEAYLGLTAYTLAMRRLQGMIGGYDGSAGVAVLMRYTLRLLTLQQFQRAAALICACESIRREDPAKWGNESFRIGLWVGMRSTPNWTADSAEIIKEYRRTGYFRSTATGGQGSPHQLTNCPWCGTPINPGTDIVVETYKHGQCRTTVYCPSNTCIFSQKNAKREGLPILVVDEEVYRRLPSLLIATVDKFAQMPWKGEAQMLFGRVNGYCSRHGYRSPDIEDKNSHPADKVFGLPSAQTEERCCLRPPDLIIQDELHLINGPLGTLVGLYETAVDSLCSWTLDGKTVRPKVIASSATIRKAPGQINSLYLRQTNIFPPNGLLIKDNFFSRQRTPDESNPGRLYLGICAPGSRLKVVMIRSYVAVLSAAQQLYEKYGAMVDPYMTLVGYFNAMRDLGGLRRVLDDAIRTRLRHMEKRGLANRNLDTYSIAELTSRIGATDIPEILDRLGATFDPIRDAERKKKRKAGEKVASSSYPIDTLLATNMISVGVDVPRLGLMVVAGQPKYTSEYIQATSRIGRRYPGLVLTVYNWARPRDLSHYERFEHYHSTLYHQVEALSVTPFSPRAIDRGLTALLVSFLRLYGFDFNGNESAALLKRDHPSVKMAIDEISRRAGLVTGNPQIEQQVRQELISRIDHWLARAAKLAVGGSRLGYKGKADGRTLALLVNPNAQVRDLFTCLTSLRDVEPSVNLVLNNYEIETPVNIEGPTQEQETNQ
ncbi:MAG TPA: DISARM system helicase DrmA [Bellilinea sp.]|nr:DISARM system helicase DrmA [Bellilinea sp.]